MYTVKLIRKVGKASRRERTFECEHYEVLEVREESFAAEEGLREPGVYLELVKDKASTFLVLPRDGAEAYVVNADGKTIAKYTPSQVAS